jgi:ribosomal-protein-serine acetyltransferase
MMHADTARDAAAAAPCADGGASSFIIETVEPLLIDLPEHMETVRLRLQVPTAHDGVRIYPAAKASLEQLKPWMPWAKDDYSPRDAEIWCRRVRGEFHLRKQLQFMILDRASGEHLGNLGAFKFNWDVRSGEIGYWLHTDHTGQGLMTEAVTALRDYLLQQQSFRRIEIRCDDRNSRSARVAERCGFALEAVLHNVECTPQGELRHNRIYAYTPAVT